MKKLMIITAAVLAACMLLTGCVKERYPLPQNAKIFEQGEYYDPDDPEAGYVTITYEGRVYAPFGVQDGVIKESDVEGAIGWVYRPDFPDDQGERVIKLKGTNDFLMVYYVNGIMEPRTFYRALDTAGKEITIPSYIVSQDYGIWK